MNLCGVAALQLRDYAISTVIQVIASRIANSLVAGASA
jgi:hypothetical protein